jgi:uncharacterized protein
MIIPIGELELEAVLWEPRELIPQGAVLVCHPHPLHGGTMNNRVVYRAAKGAVDAGLAALRFNFRGVGASTGSHDDGHGEQQDIGLLLTWLEQRYPLLPLALVGFSFGAWVGLKAASRDPRMRAMVGLGLPINTYDFEFLLDSDIPSLFIVGTQDEFCPAVEMKLLARRLPPTAAICWVEGADHFFTKQIDQVRNLVRNFLQVRFKGSHT